MMEDSQLYQSWRTPGSYFSRMLDCGDRYNLCVQNALEYIPRDILNEHKDRLAFFAMCQRDGCRLPRRVSETREIIILAEHVLRMCRGKDEGQPEFRYLTYVVLHEVAHAIRRHRSPLYDSLTQEAVALQEAEADSLALEWFNAHVEMVSNPCLPRLTREEIAESQVKSKALMES